MADSRELHGRTAIYSDAEGVDASNVLEVLEDALATHDGNASDISYLYDYYRGRQPILERTKTYNTTINNKIVENRAKEISDFKTGYFLSAPLQLIDATTQETTETFENSEIGKLARWMRSEAKDANDLELAFWQSICGTAYRMFNPKDEVPEDDTVAPFELIVLDPRYTFVVYNSAPSHKPILGVSFVTDSDGNATYYCYTASSVFVVADDEITSSKPHLLGQIPIVEYPLGPTRMGDFEPVIPLLDALNLAESNRLDGVEQFVQAIMVLKGVDVGDMEQFLTDLREMGGMRLTKDGDAKYLTLNLDQTQTQTLVHSLYDAVRDICGMPRQYTGYPYSSDTGSAVFLRDGWSTTEAMACRTETWFRRSERRFLDMAIDFCNTVGGLNLRHQDVDIRFPRRNYTNDSANVDNLIKLLSSDWVTPEQAFEHSSMFPDPHSEYLKALAWHDQREAETVNSLLNATEEPEPEPEQVEVL